MERGEERRRLVACSTSEPTMAPTCEEGRGVKREARCEEVGLMGKKSNLEGKVGGGMLGEGGEEPGECEVGEHQERVRRGPQSVGGERFQGRGERKR